MKQNFYKITGSNRFQVSSTFLPAPSSSFSELKGVSSVGKSARSSSMLEDSVPRSRRAVASGAEDEDGSSEGCNCRRNRAQHGRLRLPSSQHQLCTSLDPKLPSLTSPSFHRQAVIQFLRKELNWKPNDPLVSARSPLSLPSASPYFPLPSAHLALLLAHHSQFTYINSSFSPAPDDTVSNLFKVSF